jgi:hypothetical protein
MATQKAAAAAVVSFPSPINALQKEFTVFPVSGLCPHLLFPWSWKRCVGPHILISPREFEEFISCSETIASLQAFRKRHADAQRLNAQYASQPTTVDFSHYRSILKNKAIVDEAEKLLKEFKPVTYDVNAQIKAIEAFEAKAVSVLAKFCKLAAQDAGD